MWRTNLTHRDYLKFLLQHKLISNEGRIVNRPASFQNNPLLEPELIKYTSFLSADATTKERIWNLLVNNLSAVKCCVCDDHAKFNTSSSHYYRVCGDSACKYTRTPTIPLRDAQIKNKLQPDLDLLKDVHDEIIATEQIDMIECMVCGTKLNSITNTHLAQHGINLSQYRERYPTAPLVDSTTLTKLSAASTRTNASRRGTTRSQEVKDKISRTKLDNPTPSWNRGIPMTQEAREHLSTLAKDRAADPNYVHPRTGAILSDEQKQQISASLKTHHAQRTDEERELTNSRRRDTFAAKREQGWIPPATTPEVVQKREATMVDRYGISNAMHHPELANRQRQTVLERYGHNNAAQSPLIQERRRATLQAQYGQDNIMLTKVGWISQRRGYGTCSHLSDDELGVIYDTITNADWLIEQHHVLEKPIWLITEELGLPRTQYHTISRLMKSFDIEIKYFNTSVGQKEIADWICELTDKEVIINDRTTLGNNLELDIYIPDLKLAFEYNGVYWHASRSSEDDVKMRSRHLRKTSLCEDMGIRLIQIFETEWINQSDIVKSRIASLIGRSTRVFARKCKLIPVDFGTAKQFCNDNHIQGHAVHSIALGLEYQGELISLVTFGKPRYDDHADWELIRFANKLGLTVVGGASKLLAAFKRSHPSATIISYADRRWSQGNLYHQLGFELAGTTRPNYYYFHAKDGMVLQSRIKYQKHKLSQLLPTFNEHRSESQNMYDHGYSRIWDCGNTKWILP